MNVQIPSVAISLQRVIFAGFLIRALHESVYQPSDRQADRDSEGVVPAAPRTTDYGQQTTDNWTTDH